MFYKICKFRSSTKTNDVKVTSLPKDQQNSYLRETKQIIYHSKGIDESYPKMYFYWIWANMGKFMGIFRQILAFLWCQLTKYGHVTWPTWSKKKISKICYFVSILHLILGKVTKFQAGKLSSSKFISQKPHRGDYPPPPSAFPQATVTWKKYEIWTNCIATTPQSGHSVQYFVYF